MVAALWRLPSARLRSYNALESGERREANIAFFGRCLSRQLLVSPLRDLPDWRVTAASG